MTGDRPALRLGLIGAGRWGSNYVRTIQAMTEAVLTRVSTKSSDVSALVGPECRVDRRWQSLVDAGDLDGVIIATPPRLHFQIARYALRHDLPVLVEKPLTMDVREARALQALAVDRGVPMLVDHVYLFHPAYRALRAELHGRRLLTITAQAGNDGPLRSDASVLWDYGPHDVAMCLDLVGETPTGISATRVEGRQVGDAFGEIIELRLEFPSGTKAELSLSNLLRNRTRYFSVVTGSDQLVFDDSGEDRVYREPSRTAGERRPIPYAAELPLTVAVREFGEAIVAKRPDEKAIQLAVDVVAVLARCAAALGQGDRQSG
jgi:predicted dehydrogenase